MPSMAVAACKMRSPLQEVRKGEEGRAKCVIALQRTSRVQCRSVVCPYVQLAECTAFRWASVVLAWVCVLVTAVSKCIAESDLCWSELASS
eukprot:1036828-Pelagomonas_calceolata.AAC.2